MEAASGSHIYTEINPRCEWIKVGEFDTLLVDVSGFKKEELKVQIDSSRNLKISGRRPLDGNRWCRFLSSFQLPQDCNPRLIQAKFAEGHLYILLPPNPVSEAVLREQEGGDAYDQYDEQHKEEMEEDAWAQTMAKNNRQWIKLTFGVLMAIIALAGLGTFAAYKLRNP